MPPFVLDSLGQEEYESGMSLLPEATMLLLSGGSVLFNPLPQPGEAAYRDLPEHSFQLCYENDASFGDDCNYTHGTRLSYTQSFSECRFWGLSLTQNIYTPVIHSRHAVEGEHPYAGTLSLGGAILRCESYGGMCTEFQIGTTGNASLARYMQNGLHKLGGMLEWEGWDDQVPAEVTFQLTQRFDVDLPFLATSFGNGWGTDGLVMTRAELGTVTVAGGTGLSFRIGKNLPDSMEVLGNRAGHYGIGLIAKPEYRRQDASYFLVASVYAEYVARDITIDGGAFRHFDRTCGRKPWQMEGRLGVGVSYKGIDYYAGALLHSRSYRSQDGNSAMGAFSIGWRW